MAKQLYDYWFVQFDFPNEEGKPYKSSGEVMVYNERLGREIPQGWSTMPISGILDKYPTTKRYETKEYLSCGKYPIIDQGDSYIAGFTNEIDHLLTRHPAVCLATTPQRSNSWTLILHEELMVPKFYIPQTRLYLNTICIWQ